MVFESLFQTATKGTEGSPTVGSKEEIIKSEKGSTSGLDDSQKSPKEKKKKKKKKKKTKTTEAIEQNPKDKVNSVVDTPKDSPGEKRKAEKRPDDGTQNSSKRPRYQHQYKPPSKEALDLSAKLKDLSMKKKLQETLDLYYDKINDGIRDCHHTCILVDCAARCGAIHEGEKAVSQMKETGAPINVETKTALLKGYAHAGMMQKATLLFREMCACKDRRNRPNVRSLNTLLRGCLWSAATIGKDSDGVERLWGGIVTSEEAWKTCWHISRECFDSSSYEYYIVQLCYALRLGEAEKQLIEMKRNLKIETVGDTFTAKDPRVLESLAFVLVALARGYTLLGQFKEAETVAKQSISAIESVKKASSDSVTGDNQTKRVHGGKRAWKDSDASSRRTESNTLYRNHRLSEISAEAENIMMVAKKSCVSDTHLMDLCRSLLTQLLYFSGGGTTGLENTDAKIGVREAAKQLACSSGVSFGLFMAYTLGSSDKRAASSLFSSVATNKLRKKVMDFAGLCGQSVLTGDGALDLSIIFPQQKSAPLDIELGSGFGDWIVTQARAKTDRNFIAVELRSDRVAQTFSRAMMEKERMRNLCCVGAEASSFLRDHIRKKCVSTIFVNHPEPPTQTYGIDDSILNAISEGGDEPGHMLASNLLVIAGECLKPGSGRLIIVTDNRYYGRLICATLVKVMKMKSRGNKFKPIVLKEEDGFVVNESFEENVSMFEGQPDDSIGHTQQGEGGQSYFDRLWKSGAGSHADRVKRFVVGFTR